MKHSENNLDIFEKTRHDISKCTHCSEDLPHTPKPIFLLARSTRIAIIGQAPGKVAHDTGIPWNDNSGAKLRRWLGIDEDTFYTSTYLSLIPMGFCFPGYKNGADAPPLKACSALWHKKVLDLLKPEITILVGRYAQKHYCPEFKTLTDAVKSNKQTMPNKWVLPHPSGRNNRWITRHPWFESETIPAIQAEIQRVLSA